MRTICRDGKEVSQLAALDIPEQLIGQLTRPVTVCGLKQLRKS
ncbi:MAG: hypothetical protein ACLVEJ_13760 [Parabacteroides sp.]